MIPNVAPGLLGHLQWALTRTVDAEDLLAYIAAVVAHSGYTRLFRHDLAVPGIRVPLSADRRLWDRAIPLGREVVWLHTFSTRPDNNAAHQIVAQRPHDHDGSRITCAIPYSVEEMPDTVHYEEQTQTIHVGLTGQVAPVPPAVWRYRVGGMRVVEKWIRYRLKNPRGRPASSPLDEINARSWPQSFNDDLLKLLHVLGRLVELEPAQEALLHDICVNPMIDTLQLHDAGILPVPASARRPTGQHNPVGQLAI